MARSISYPDKDGRRTPGYDFCRALEEDARQVGVGNTIAAWTFGILGAGAAAAGGIISAQQADRDNRTVGIVGSSLSLGGPMIAALSWAFFSRADSAAALGEAANRSMAINREDEAAYRDCLEAKAIWVGSRSDANGQWSKRYAERPDQASGSAAPPTPPVTPPSAP